MKVTAMDRSLATSTPRRARRPGIFHRFVLMRALFRQRATLAQLDDHLLRDIGLTPEQAQAEADRPFWDVPSHWRR